MFYRLSLAALALFVAPGLADEPQKVPKVRVLGVIKKVDPSADRLTIAVKGDKTPADREFQILPTTRFTFLSAKDKKECVGREAYKQPQFKEGAEVAVTDDGKGRAVAIQVGTSPVEDGKK